MKSHLSFHYPNPPPKTGFCQNFRESKSKSIFVHKNLADINADELFENFDNLFEVRVKESSNPDSYRVDTARTIIKDLSKKFNDMSFLQNINLSRLPTESTKRIEIPSIQDRKYLKECFVAESFLHTRTTPNQNEHASKVSINTNSFTKRFEEFSFEGRNKSFHVKTSVNLGKIPKANDKIRPYLMVAENKENFSYLINNNNNNKNSNNSRHNGILIEDQQKTSKINSKNPLHKRVETNCDIITSIDDETLKKVHHNIPSKKESLKSINKSLMNISNIQHEKKKNREMNSFENVGRLLKLLKQDAEKKANRKADLSFTSTNFLKPQVNKIFEKEKNMKRSISTGYARK